MHVAAFVGYGRAMSQQNGAQLHRIGERIWTLDGDRISFLTFPYELRMTIVQLADESLFLHSPVQLTDERRASVSSLGPVSAIVTPNKLHHLFLSPWASAFPDAKLYAPPGLCKKRPDLPFAGELGDSPETQWEGILHQCVVRGSFFMEEVLFFHIASATLIVGDLIENHDPQAFSPWQRGIGRLNCMLAPDGATPMNYRLSFLSRKRARADIERVLSWGPRQVVVMHGPCIFVDAEAFLRRAFAWLSPA